MLLWVRDDYRPRGLALGDRIGSAEDDDGGVGGRDLGRGLLGQDLKGKSMTRKRNTDLNNDGSPGAVIRVEWVVTSERAQS